MKNVSFLNRQDESITLNLTDDKADNIKSGTYLRLEKMIEQLEDYRINFAGKRIPFFVKMHNDRK